MESRIHIDKIVEYIDKCMMKGQLNSADIVEIIKQIEPYSKLQKVSKGKYSPQYYYQSNKVVDLFGCKLILND